MDAGAMDRRATIQRRATGVDGYGQASGVWQTLVADVAGKVVYGRSEERRQLFGQDAVAFKRFDWWMHALMGIELRPTDRLVLDDGTVCDILAIAAINRRAQWRLTCEARLEAAA